MRRREVRKPAEGEQSPRHSAAMETVLFAKLMPFLEHLAVNRYDDGEPRKPGRCFIETFGPSWVVVLKEPDAGLEMKVVGDTIDNAIVLADLLLAAEDAPWTPDPWAQQKAAAKKKK